jgi:hypothetical protein
MRLDPVDNVVFKVLRIKVAYFGPIKSFLPLLSLELKAKTIFHSIVFKL